MLFHHNSPKTGDISTHNPELIDMNQAVNHKIDTVAVTKILLLICLALLLHSCSGSVQQPEIMAQPGTAPQPSPSITRALPPYIIHPGDTLDIKFFYNKELDEQVMVRPDGRISLQLVHDVMAAGLSTDELIKVLSTKYEPFLKDPEISVIVKKFDAQRVYVDGEVYRPGMVEMGGYMDVMQAIASAGGMKESALEDEILVIRHNGLGKPLVMKVDLAKAKEMDPSQNIRLHAYDIVYVPKSAIAHVNTWVDLYIRKNIPINLDFGLYKSIY